MRAPFLQYPLHAPLSASRFLILQAFAAHVRERLGDRWRFVTGYSKF